jgi:hypothetical protein
VAGRGKKDKSKRGRKFWRNYIGRDKAKGSKYVERKKRQGTYKIRKSHSKKR